MQRYFYILICYLVTFIPIHGMNGNDSLLDSIMDKVMRHAAMYNGVTQSYEANVYMKTYVETHRKNILYRFSNEIPNFVIHDPHNDKAVIESVSILKFNAPRSFSQDIKYVTGTLTKKRDIALLPFRFVSMDIYAESAHAELFYLPLRRKSAENYRYSIIQIEEIDNKKFYTIHFQPRFKHPQLIEGNFTVMEDVWRVTKMSGAGTDFFVDFSFDLVMGQQEADKYLPVKFNINQTYNYLGNRVVNQYTTTLKYDNITFRVRIPSKPGYNLGNRYKMRLDSVPLNNDSVLWESLRTVALREEEQDIVKEYKIREKNKQHQQATDVASNPINTNTLKLMKNMVANSNYRFKSGDMRYSGLLNPGMIGFSTRDGFSYRQRFGVNFDLPRHQQINTSLSAGYIFGRKQLNYSLKSRWNYEPGKMGYLLFSAGRGNPTLSSKILEEFADSLDFVKDRYLRYYKDHYVKLYNNIELHNGLQLGVGVEYHIREPNKLRLANGKTDNSVGIFPTQYMFGPKISISWTPAQFYIQDRNQKVYLRSDYPTFKFEYEQSIPGVLGSEASYSKFEFDINQQINFGLMSSLNYHAGFGMFTRQKNEYFNDFSYFAKSYYPDSWEDGIGGGFMVLSRRFYNTAPNYAQAQLMYEASKFALTRIEPISPYLLRERVYFSQLYTPYIKSYTEIGYGVGNRYVNAAVFVGFHKTKYDNIGARAVFLL